MSGGTADLAQRARIGAAFAAAQEYDRHARVQHKVALELVERVSALSLAADARVLEIGCGTGFLTAELVRRGIGASLIVTDLAPAMVERCQSRVGEAPALTYRALDGEQGERPVEAPFDLIVSSLTFQWFDDLPRALARLAGWLAPRGTLAFTTLAAGTFAEWHNAHRAAGASAGTPRFASADELARMAPPGTNSEIVLTRHLEPQGSARGFLHSLKAIGAGTAAADHRPLPPRVLRQVMANFEAEGAAATYEVATCLFTRAAP